MDGVLYLSEQALPGAAQLLETLTGEGTPFLLVTNNASRTPADFSTKLERMGMRCPAERILTSARAAAALVAEESPGARVLAVGEEGLQAALLEAGLQPVEEDPQTVVVGIDRRFTYERGQRAAQAIRSGARFVGTNPDATYPTPSGLAPGCGAILAFIQAAAGRAPRIVGKPEPHLFRQGLRLLGSEPGETLMLGDRPDTDIAGAKRAGLLAALLRTGVGREAAGDGGADWVFPELPAFLEAWRLRR